MADPADCDQNQDTQNFLEMSGDISDEDPLPRKKSGVSLDLNHGNNNIFDRPKSNSAYYSLNDISVHPSNALGGHLGSESSSSSSVFYQDRATNRQDYDRRLSVFLGTTRPFQRRRTREEQEIETNFRWSMCLCHRLTLVFFACIFVFIVGIIVSLSLKE